MSNLTAGRELDALVAERVIGEPCPPVLEGDDQWSEVFSRNHDGQLYSSPLGAWYAVCEYDHDDNVVWYPRPYSTSIAAAWEVVEKLETLHLQHGGKKFGMWQAEFCDHTGDNAVEADTAPLAICLAALKAVGHE